MQSTTLLHVASDPTAVTIVWIPGTMTAPCAAQIGHFDRATAVELAAAVDAAPAIPTSPTSCPMATGVAAELYFGFAAADQGAVVDIGLDGCRVVTGPGASGRQLTPRLDQDLIPLAPAPWKGLVTAGLSVS